jgi:hypothetical protein
MAIEDLLPHVHPAVVYRRVPLPDGQNALLLLDEAAGAIQFSDDEYESFFPAACEAEPTCGLPTLALLESAETIVARNLRPLQLVESAIHCGALQLPDNWPALCSKVEGLRRLVRLIVLRGAVHATRCNWKSAANDAIRLLRLGEMVCRGDGGNTGYLVGQAFRGAAVSCMMRLGQEGQMPIEPLRPLIAALQDHAARPDGLAGALRSDFHTDALAHMERLASCPTLDSLVQMLVDDYYGPIDESSYATGPTPTSERLRSQIVRLLDSHPRPFDAATTVRQLSLDVARSLARLAGPYRQAEVQAGEGLYARVRNRLLPDTSQRVRRTWPMALQPEPTVISIMRRMTAYLVAEGEEGVPPPPPYLPVAEADLQRAAGRLRALDNPVGVIVCDHESHSNPMLIDTPYQHQAHVNAALAIMGLRVYRETLRRLPRVLSEIVRAGILGQVPMDVMAGRALRYSPERGIVWSVGRNGRDDGGDSNGLGWMAPDMVWPIDAPAAKLPAATPSTISV